MKCAHPMCDLCGLRSCQLPLPFKLVKFGDSLKCCPMCYKAACAWGGFNEKPWCGKDHTDECLKPPFGWNCSRESGHAGPCAASEDQNYVAWLRYAEDGRIVTCDSDAPHAFKVYRAIGGVR